MADEHRLEHDAQRHIRSVTIAIGVEGMVKDDNLPGFTRLGKRAIDPLQLRRIHEVGIEEEEPCRPPGY
jgi:hypothetical protein